MKIKSVIVEDERANRDNLMKLLSDYCPGVEVVALCCSAVEARKQISRLKPDLLFLDIEMPGGNGFSLLDSIENIDFEVIFVTAFDHYGIKAVKFCALDYLLKPVDILELSKAVEKAEKRIKEKLDKNRMQHFIANMNLENRESKKIALPLSDKIEFVKVDTIIRCKGDGNYTHIILKGGESIIVSKTLKEYDELLSEYNFLRVHQSHLINVNEIKSYIKTDGGYIKMNDGSSVSISRQRREMVLEKLKDL